MCKNSDFSVSRMFCCNCRNEGIPITRKVGQFRSPGHLKKMYCIYCQKEWNHAEIRSIGSDYTLEDFNLEMDYHNFDSEGNRIKPYRIFRGELKQKGII